MPAPYFLGIATSAAAGDVDGAIYNSLTNPRCP